MDHTEREQFSHALGQTLRFYNRDLDKDTFSFWITALADHSWFRIRRALLEYVKRGKHAPKPADIIEIITEQRRTDHLQQLPPPSDVPARRQTELDQAWIYTIKLIASTGKGPLAKGLAGDFKRLDDATEERYLHLVNHHAREQNMPDALPPEFRLAEIWGVPTL
jgi:hypothetical protein